MKRRWTRDDMNTWRLAAAARMQSYPLDLHGLTLDEAKAKVCKMIDDYQANELKNYEIMLIDRGGDPADFAAVERLRARLAENREQLIVKWRAMVARGGKGLQ